MVEAETLIIGIQTFTPDGVRHGRNEMILLDTLDKMEDGPAYLWQQIQHMRDKFPRQVEEYYGGNAKADHLISVSSVKTVLLFLALGLLTACESTTQTAIRSNQPPAIAYVVAAQKGTSIAPTVYPAPATTTVIIRDDE